MAVLPLTAQKYLKPVKDDLKARQAANALNKIKALEADSAAKDDPKLYDLAVEAEIMLNDAENEKIYLKQPCDTAKFFGSLLDIYRYALKADSVESLTLEDKGKPTPRRKKNAALLKNLYPNLGFAGRYYYDRRQYAVATTYLQVFLDMPGSALWKHLQPVPADARYRANAYCYLKSAFLSENYAAVPRYADIVLTDTLVHQNAMEMLAISARAVNDTLAYLKYLNEGLASHPDAPFFFTNLSDYYMGRGEYDKALSLAESQLQNDTTNLCFLAGKSLALLKLHRYDESIAISQKMLAADSTLADVYYNIGACYCNLANEIPLPPNVNSAQFRSAKKQVAALYVEARPYVERYRALRPDAQTLWAPLLYRIYLELNEGKLFDEIDKLLK